MRQLRWFYQRRRGNVEQLVVGFCFVGMLSLSERKRFLNRRLPQVELTALQEKLF